MELDGSDAVELNYSDDEEQDTPAPSGMFGKDLPNILLLLLLYTLQGVPMGLCQSIPLMLTEKKVSYSDQAMFSLVSWPFSLKLLWAPLVDSLYNKKFGRRKTWLIPTQFAIAVVMLYVAQSADSLLGDPSDANSAPDVWMLTVLFFGLYFLCATQDIAVDGWAITMLERENIGWASTCNSVGQSVGFALAYIGFMVLNSEEACNKYIRAAPAAGETAAAGGMVTLASFMT